MKLLLDENLSARILGILAGTFPGSQHVAEAGLRGHSDQEIWEFAKQAGFTIVGPPPKVVWLNVGNAGTQEVPGILLANRRALEAFEARKSATCTRTPRATTNPSSRPIGRSATC